MQMSRHTPVDRDPEEAILRNMLDDESDLVGMRSDQHAWPVTTDVRNQVSDFGKRQRLDARVPQLLQIVLDGRLIAARTRQLAQRFDQLKHLAPGRILMSIPPKCYQRFARGSSASRNPSPSKLIASAATTIASPGKVVVQGARRR